MLCGDLYAFYSSGRSTKLSYKMSVFLGELIIFTAKTFLSLKLTWYYSLVFSIS